MANEHKIPEIIRSSLENIRSMVDANTVIGDPINTNAGTTIIPISKISVGVATGGVDYNTTKAERPMPQNFGGGGGTGLSVTPVGFLVVDADGEVEFLNIGQKGKPDPVDQVADLVERTPDIIAKIKDLFSKEPKPTV
ncbi:MAG: sporulation protein YtfJ [Ruminococcaceae bacterium]|nr:sporulation protein YtfJ [Oscillospiraceae bacterium]